MIGVDLNAGRGRWKLSAAARSRFDDALGDIPETDPSAPKVLETLSV